jgi:hypothetical protein
MIPNPFSDAFNFLVGNTPDHLAIGGWRWLFVALFAALLVAAAAIAAREWVADPAQRTFRHASMAFMRVLIGAMWFQAVLWKLPMFSRDNGLFFWMDQMTSRAAFQLHRDLVTNVLIPLFPLLNLVVFVAELFFAVALMLGLGARLAGALMVPFTLHLWLGIYVTGPGQLYEWPWSYIFLVFVGWMFAIHAAGRSLGLDARAHRDPRFLAPADTAAGRLLRLAG